MPFLTEVHFQNYRSFLDAKCRLSPVTLVIGANNAGKSNLLTGLVGVVEAMDARVAESSWEDLSQAHSRKERMDLADLRITVRTADGAFSYHRHPADERGGAWVWHREGGIIVQGVCTYNMINSGTPVEEVPYTKEPVVCENFQGVAEVLRWLHSTNPAVFSELIGVFKEHAAGVEGLVVEGDEVLVMQAGLTRGMNLEGLSAGSQSILALLCIIHQAQRPELILVENIEHAIHPRGLAPLIETIRRISAEHGVQFIMTSQSPYVLDCFQKKEFWADVVIVEKKEGVSRLANMDERLGRLGYEQEMDKMPLGDLWYSGLMGGVANPPPIWDKTP